MKKMMMIRSSKFTEYTFLLKVITQISVLKKKFSLFFSVFTNYSEFNFETRGRKTKKTRGIKDKTEKINVAFYFHLYENVKYMLRNYYTDIKSIFLNK